MPDDTVPDDAPELWEGVKSVFQKAVELPAAEREAYVLATCLDRPELLAEVRSLLAAHEDEEPFLEGSAAEELDAEAKLEGRRIGPYRIAREIGRGGMGSVYLASRDDDAYSKKVAVKVIHQQALGGAGRQLRQRFLAERQILADLDHPNIARLLDGGSTDEGLPYLVMEYVEGTPIDVYCDAHRLGIRERLELLRTVCSAVHYAHQNLIVHRDLKPSNLLVTAEGVPKLLDFGIAKLLDPSGAASSAALTRTGLGPMTPEYASPEQVQGRPVSTASDVYALGVIAYRLLTGFPPYRVDPRRPAAMIRSIVEQEPVRPSERLAAGRLDAFEDRGSKPLWEICRSRRHPSPARLARRLHGDLDNILLTALAKNPLERYASANQLSEELYRHLAGLPIEVRGASFAYRARKWVLRNRALAAAAAITLVVLLASVVMTSRMARVAGRERAAAEARFEEVRELAGFFIFDLHDEIVELPGSTRAREKLVGVSLEYLDRLATVGGADRALLGEQAEAYRRIGDIQGQTRIASLGDTGGALGSYRRALELYEELGRRGGGAAIRARQAELMGLISEMLGLQGDWEEAERRAAEAHEIFAERAAAEPADLEARLLLAASFDRLARIRQSEGSYEEALAGFRESLRIRQEVLAERPDDLEVERDLSISLLQLGDSQVYLGRHQDALGTLREVLAIHRRLLAADPASTEALSDLAAAYERVGDVHFRLGALDPAQEHYAEARRLAEQLVAADAFDAQARRNLSIMHVRLADILRDRGDFEAAVSELTASLALRRELLAADPTNARGRRDLAVAFYKLGLVRSAHAEAARPRAEKRRLHLAARDWLEQSLAEFQAMAEEGTLAPGDRGATAELEGLIADCDAALAEL